MTLVTNLPMFLVAVVLITASPGPAFALLVRRAALRGRRYGFATIVGLEAGLYLWALLVASGFAVVMASEVGYLILKVVGCAVLGWLGMRSLRAWWAGRSRQASLAAREAAGDCPAGEVARRGALWAVGEGFVVQMANPKAAVLLLGLYSQFVPDHQSMFAATAVLGAFQVLVETVLYSALVLGVARAGHLFRSSAVARRIEAMVGTVLLGLGVRLALSQRPA